MRLGKIFWIGTLTLFSAAAFAGLAQPAPILITQNADGSGNAQGDMLTARNADNDVEFIGCGTRTIDTGTGSFSFGFCQAANAAEEMAFCSTSNADLLDAVKAVSDYSFLTFGFDESGECTRIGSSTQSFYLPEKLEVFVPPGQQGKQ